MASPSVAVVGGGLCGCAAAEALLEAGVEVSLLDMGRGGVGGRASSRAVWLSEGGAEAASADSAEQTLAFEHGCQFFATRPKATSSFGDALARAGAERWPARASGRLGWLVRGAFVPPGDERAEGLGEGLFGACSSDLELHAAPGICAKLVAALEEKHKAKLRVHRGARVTGIVCADSGSWELKADGLHHECTAEELRGRSGGGLQRSFDAVVLTDHMVFLPDWHPLHVTGLHGAAPRLVAAVRKALDWDEESRRFRSIASLFTCMLAFAPGSGPSVPFDAACVAGSAVLQWVCRQASKFPEAAEGAAECWVLVSTEAFAESCLRGEPLSERRESGEVWYKPQTDDYLKGDPAAEMLRAFQAAVGPLLPSGQLSAPLYSRCQRWGAAYPLAREAAETAPYYAASDYDSSVAASGLFAAGDWARPEPPRHAEAAFESGRAVAAAAAAAAKAAAALRESSEPEKSPKRARTRAE